MGLSLLGHVTCIFLGKTYVEVLKLVKDCTYVGKIWLRLIKGLTKCPIRRTQGSSRHFLGSVNQRTQRRPVVLTTNRWWGIIDGNLDSESINPKIGQGPIDGGHRWPVDWLTACQWWRATLPCNCFNLFKWWIGDSSHILILLQLINSSTFWCI